MQTAVRPITCNICGAKYKIPASYGGTGLTCRRCEHRISLTPLGSSGRKTTRRSTSGRHTLTMRKSRKKASMGQLLSGIAIVFVIAVVVVFLL